MPSTVVDCVSTALPYLWLIPALSCFIIATLVPAARKLHGTLISKSSTKATAWRLDQAEKGTLAQKATMSDKDIFDLERRAFFSKTWLFACHRSQFDKAGDYHTFDVAGIAFFVVLGKDGRLRAFHNVCRHRAYTVVRKPCGTSNRFSCRYHGWQYDDQGKLVKAPKFEEMPGFNPEDNGLFEIKLISTREGLIFINFDASTMHLPFNDVKSGLDMGSCKWLGGAAVKCSANWKQIATEFSNQVQWSRTPFGWFSRKKRVIKLLGPLSLAKELDQSMWCTMTLLPASLGESNVRVDLFAKEGNATPKEVSERWKWMLQQEVQSFAQTDDVQAASAAFSYECGGRMIDLSAILGRHQRAEAKERRKVQPAIRVTGHDDVDQEAAAVCDAVDGVADNLPEIEVCTRVTSWTRRMEW